MNITLDNVRKTYQKGQREIPAVAGVDMQVEEGEFLVLMGVSGSGKSTLLNLMGGLAKPTSGSIRVDGEELSTMNSDGLALHRRRNVGFVFQAFHLVPTLTVAENVLLPPPPTPVDPQERQQHADVLLDRVGMADRADHLPSELSGGEQQRAAIARALINDPALLLADEPTSDLDTKTGMQIAELLKELNADGKTVVLATHDERLGASAGRLVRMQDGRLSTD